jgi:hypothetical protein
MKPSILGLVLVALWLSLSGALPGACLAAAEASSGGRVDIILWFDTEDYILPASDDAAKRLAELLSARDIRATFKIVGEKARTLERRGRRDVIAALRKHAIAYHTDFHSVHPTPTEYLADCGFLDGVAEFVRREGNGAADVRRIFGVKTLACYGQPGSSWAPQAVAALKQIGVAPAGVPCYVDDGDHVGLDDKPFWYAGALNVYGMGANCTRMELHDPAAVQKGRQQAAAVAGRLAKEGGGLISIYYHPCEWVHRQFWDGVNFSRGHNPPREQWQLPPQRSAEETDAAFRRFADYVDFLRALPGVRFVTASDLPGLYPDLARTQGATEAELAELARRIAARGTNGLDFQVLEKKAFSMADQFELLTLAVSVRMEGKPLRFPAKATGLLGPDNSPPGGPRDAQCTWAAVRVAVANARGFIQSQQRVPARIFLGPDAVAPADFLVALASVYAQFGQQETPGESVVLGSGTEVRPARHVAKDTPGLYGGWVIHREGFRAPKVLEVARLQAWTLKPALRKEP